MPKPAMPPAALEASPPNELATPPSPILVSPFVANPPNPPSAPPKAVPTPGINIAIGATFLTTFLRLFPIFLKKPNCSKPVVAFKLAIPIPATASSGFISNSLNLRSSIDSNCASSKNSGGITTSPGLKCANSVSSPSLACFNWFAKSDNGACVTCWPFCNKCCNLASSS